MTGKLTVKIIEADQLKKPGFGGHKPKPFVTAKLGSARVATEKIEKYTPKPQWNEAMVFNVVAGMPERLQVELKDMKKGAEETLGVVTLNFGKLVAAEGGIKSSEAAWYPLTKPDGQQTKGRLRISMQFESPKPAPSPPPSSQPIDIEADMKAMSPMMASPPQAIVSSPPKPPVLPASVTPSSPPMTAGSPPKAPISPPQASAVASTSTSPAVVPPPPPPPPPMFASNASSKAPSPVTVVGEEGMHADDDGTMKMKDGKKGKSNPGLLHCLTCFSSQ
eukprot:CAMPEP_0184657780 /NCGR_PEP_ID=MMETSP0308-20130426/21766_1 /TAXON_ID=38269 /ORGANISM="Gloeochaete witrockiana, Strain SAG 46.84" /LENGTH=276 /DNA_ID=CAMNT_0027096047 /DNA_START=230 /DNA_END=1060 /DNA_ORIENTATION=-